MLTTYPAALQHCLESAYQLQDRDFLLQQEARLSQTIGRMQQMKWLFNDPKWDGKLNELMMRHSELLASLEQ